MSPRTLALTLLSVLALALPATARGASGDEPVPDARMLLDLDLLRETDLARQRDLLARLGVVDRLRMLEMMRWLDAEGGRTPAAPPPAKTAPAPADSGGGK